MTRKMTQLETIFFLRELLLDIAQNVEFAEAHVQQQSKFPSLGLSKTRCTVLTFSSWQ